MKQIVFIALCLVLSSCEFLWLKPQTDPSPTQIFEEAWSFANEEYSFFEFKGIDWDDAYNRYSPMVNDEMTDVELFDLIADMLFELRDGHVNLSSTFDISRNSTWYLDSDPNFNFDVLERNYYIGEQRFASGFIVMDFGDVGYVRYSSFTRTINGEVLDDILTDFQDKNGLIIDVRNNGGGSTLNGDRFVGHIIDQNYNFGDIRYKNGPGRNDFSAPQPITLPPLGDTSYTKPIMLLTNRSSYSATNTFTLMMTQLPNVTVIGDTTGGGGGYPANTELSNGWDLRVSSSIATMPDGFNVEDGIAPDIRVDLDSAQLALGIDAILERALAELR